MNNIQQRKYYKIFSGTNQTDGYDNIHLGYEAETTEIILKKDQTTFYHFPFFTGVIPLSTSTLGADGAAAGPIPAMADRIFKKLGNYGKTTPWGNTTQHQDGTWLCSWYYSDFSSKEPIWLDRYYNPGRIAYKEALEGKANFNDYIKNDPIYFDVPSTFIFEPGNYYQYFHRGEETTTEIINSLAGNDKTNLKLNIEDWSCMCPDDPRPTDNSIYNNNITIENFKNEWIVESVDPGYIDRNILSFDNADFIDCRVKYNKSYIPDNDFTISFWVKNKNWKNATSTQLVGNLYQSGFSLFFNNLNYNPFFVIPENFYGHLFHFNIDGEIYLDKNIQYRLGEPVNLSLISINLNAEIIGYDKTNNLLLKYNQLGDILTISQDISGNRVSIQEGDEKCLVLDKDNNVILINTTGTYIFDQDLILQSFNSTLSGGYKELATFNMNGNLIRELSCIDIKFDNLNNKWAIKELNGKQILTFNNNVLPNFTNTLCTNLAIDPNNNLWVLAESNKVYILNTETQEIISNFNIGVESPKIDIKNISFIKHYNRKRNLFTWYTYIYHNNEKTLYQVTLDGEIFKSLFLPSKLNILDPVTALQDKNLLTFNSRGDFTGYEQRRVFHKVLYNKNSQLQFKVSEDSVKEYLPNTIRTLSVPVQYLIDDTWHLITITKQNKNITLYIDNFARDTLNLSNNINFVFKNDLIIGCPNGKNTNINNELKTGSIIWNGAIDSIKIYNYVIKEEYLNFLAENKVIGFDIVWNINTTPLQYIDVIERVFKHRLPGHKSNFFNIKLSGSSIKDHTVRKTIENNIRLAIEKIKPAYTELLRVEWID